MTTTSLQLIVCVVMVATFAGFAWAIRCLFTRSSNASPAMKFIATLGTVTFVTHCVGLWLAPTPLPMLVLACILHVLAASLFVWSVRETRRTPLSLAFDAAHAPTLRKAGPYALVRHPFYVSYSLYWFAGAACSGRWWTVLPAAILIGAYVITALAEEARLRASPFRAEYERYSAQVGMFIPRVRSLIRVTHPSKQGEAL